MSKQTPNERARQWLLDHDPEHDWRQYPPGTDFVGALLDNLTDFSDTWGSEEQEAILIVRAAWTKL